MSNTIRRMVLVAVAAAAVLAGSGCSRGLPRETRNLVIIPDMEIQRKYKAQGYTDFFADHRTMRTPPEGTVARGSLHEDDAFYRGFTLSGDDTVFAGIPVSVTRELMERGQNRFNIYCSPCHDRTGSGGGIVIGYGFVPPPSFHMDRTRAFEDGYIFHVITEGVRNMPSYAAQIPPRDRWAIVSYVRALQRSQHATLADVPPSARGELE